jgi:RNA polymerase sigma-70 factor (ECF subfamily)
MNIDTIQEPKAEEPLESLIPYPDLLKMIQSLSNAYRTVFNLYVMDGYKHEEIAQELGINIATSKSNLARARAKLREMVQQKLNDQYG